MNYAEELIKWYNENKREMPWRNTRDPYCIWVSEVMLQQTQVDTVIPYYERFIERFSTPTHLAEASEEEVYQYWQGLGYYRRAKNLHNGAKMIVEQYDGIFPNNPKLAKEIPGIGPYTLGAVMSIAFDIPLPAVDGNVMRILSRQFLIDEDIAKAKSRKVFEEKVIELMPHDPNRFNQALMELGATICTPRNPKCTVCPVQQLCQGYSEGVMLEYPVKSKKGQQVEEYYDALVILKEGKLFIQKREESGLLANLWGLPLRHGEAWEQTKLNLTTIETLPCIKHIFTHKKWFMTPIIISYTETFKSEMLEKLLEEGQFIAFENIKDYPIGTAFTKIINQIVNRD